MNPIVIYFSYTNNTAKTAYTISQYMNCDMVEIQLKTPYSPDYRTVVEDGKREVEQGFQPEIKSLLIDISKYDTIILGTPVWWYTFAPAIHTFLKETNLNGKAIYPFITNGGWIGHTLEDIKNVCGDSDVKEALYLKFNKSDPEFSEEEVQNWVNCIHNG